MKIKIKDKFFNVCGQLGLGIVLVIFGFHSVETAIAEDVNLEYLSRGEAAQIVVNKFDLESVNEEFLKKCHAEIADCIFVFAAKSNFDGISEKPLVMYPDVFPRNRYYKAINTLSLLEIASGYYGEQNSPYMPYRKISKAEAIKLILGASGKAEWKEEMEISKNELSSLLQKLGYDNLNGFAFWQVRYFALWKDLGLGGFVSNIMELNDPLTKDEFVSMIEKINEK